MLTMDVSQAIHSHYPGGARKTQITRNIVSKNNRTTDILLHGNTFQSELPAMNQTFLTLNSSPTANKDQDYENSVYFTQRSVDPNTLLPPCGLSRREKAETERKELAYPSSPAFVSIYKIG